MSASFDIGTDESLDVPCDCCGRPASITGGESLPLCAWCSPTREPDLEDRFERALAQFYGSER